MPTPTRSDAERIDYLRKAFSLDPSTSAEELIRLRRQFHDPSFVAKVGGAKAAISTGVDEAEAQLQRRRELAGQLESIRANFWKTPLEELRAQLKKIGKCPFKELSAGAKRLHVVAGLRPQLAALTEEQGFDGELFQAFKSILVLSPADGLSIREDFASKHLRKAAGLNRAVRMAKVIQRNTPELYELEDEWLSSLAAYQTMVRSGAQQRAPSGESQPSYFDSGSNDWFSSLGGYFIWIIVWIVIKMILIGVARQ